VSSFGKLRLLAKLILGLRGVPDLHMAQGTTMACYIAVWW